MHAAHEVSNFPCLARPSLAVEENFHPNISQFIIQWRHFEGWFDDGLVGYGSIKESCYRHHGQVEPFFTLLPYSTTRTHSKEFCSLDETLQYKRRGDQSLLIGTFCHVLETRISRNTYPLTERYRKKRVVLLIVQW